jgi:hypothetical protein
MSKSPLCPRSGREISKGNYIMKKLLNFAHPLNAKTGAQIQAIEGNFEEIIVSCQLDFNGKALNAQVADIEASAPIRLMEADLVVPPAFSEAAYLLAEGHLISGSDDKPKSIWLKKEGSPPEFVLGGIE